MRTSKEYLFYYLKDNILIFDVFDYIEEISADAVDYFFEWNMVKGKKCSFKLKALKEFLNKKIFEAEIHINQKLKEKNCKVLCFYREKEDLNLWSNYFENPLKVITTSKRMLKSRLSNFIEIDSKNPLFQTVNGHFNGIPCIIPTGEDEEFLQKNKKKLRTAIDNAINVG